jgi:hypothetical protein
LKSKIELKNTSNLNSAKTTLFNFESMQEKNTSLKAQKHIKNQKKRPS